VAALILCWLENSAEPPAWRFVCVRSLRLGSSRDAFRSGLHDRQIRARAGGSRGDVSKEAELLVLGHENAVLRR
jgi:hypothetical protein